MLPSVHGTLLNGEEALNIDTINLPAETGAIYVFHLFQKIRQRTNIKIKHTIKQWLKHDSEIMSYYNNIGEEKNLVFLLLFSKVVNEAVSDTTSIQPIRISENFGADIEEYDKRYADITRILETADMIGLLDPWQLSFLTDNKFTLNLSDKQKGQLRSIELKINQTLDL